MNSSRGFSLVELAVVLVIFGLVLGFGIPMFQHFNTTHQLTAATENMAAQVRLMREKAIGTGQAQTMHFFYATYGGDYHIRARTAALPAQAWSSFRTRTATPTP